MSPHLFLHVHTSKYSFPTLFKNFISTTSSPQFLLHNFIFTTSSPQLHLHNCISTTSFSQLHLHNFISTTLSPQLSLHNSDFKAYHFYITMDEYGNFSFSDSWSVEKELQIAETIFQNVETITHGHRDYTPEFTTDMIFESREDLLAWVRRVGLENGIVVVIKNSTLLKGNNVPRLILSCERGGKYKPPRYLVEGQQLQRNTGTRKCECPFELRGIPQYPEFVRWGSKVVCGFHNHEPAEYLDGHEFPSRLKPDEKQLVFDMANNTKPRYILSMIKEKDPSNTTGMRSVYNAIHSNKKTELDGLTAIQFVLDQLIKKKYRFEFLSNPNTNEVTDIIWCDPTSLELSVNFPSVLIIDATYKTNEYRLPLLEVVGITSTELTYSLMFAYLNKEDAERITWALSILKKWMVEAGADLPTVFVSDRDLALIKAIETCFPTANRILCIWHINQNVTKNCSAALGPLWKQFLISWQSLIHSSSPSSFQQRWNAMCDDYIEFPKVIQYLWETWLFPYKEQFVSAWTNEYMHLGSNSSQRAESAHARLKLYLGDTMSSLQTSFVKIQKMLKIQFGDIKKSFERSINIPRHKQLHDPIYDEVRCRVSLEALDRIGVQLQRASEASYEQAGICKCFIKKTHGLPCMHDLALYLHKSIPIPLSSIHPHWRKLSIHAKKCYDDGAQPDRTLQVVEILQDMDSDMRDYMIDKIFDMTDPTRSSIRVPSYNTKHRGRPAGKEEQSTQRIPSSLEASTKGSGTSHGRGRGRHGKGSAARNKEPTYAPPKFPSILEYYMMQLPATYRRYISNIGDVRGDGHCGFRAIAAQLGHNEDDWAQVRRDLIEEIHQNKDLYDMLYPMRGQTEILLSMLNYFEPIATEGNWMDSMLLGPVIASRYNLVLHIFDTNVSSCFTHLPLRSTPVHPRQRRVIAIAHIENHFVQIFLHPHYPVPPIPIWWWNYASNEARGWADIYAVRIQLWNEIMTTDAPDDQFGGNID